MRVNLLSFFYKKVIDKFIEIVYNITYKGVKR